MAKPVVLITGTSRGIGRFLVDHFLECGYTVAGLSRRKVDWEVDDYHHFAADVADEQAVKKVFHTLRHEMGGVDVLINNAGIAAMNHAVLTPMSTVEKVLNTNVVGTFLCCREAAKLMSKRRWGRIVNFSTVAVPLKLQGEAVYAASKAAVTTLTEVLAHEIGELGITVNAVGPVPIPTDLIRGVPKRSLDKLVHRQAIRRYGTYEDVANVIDFFLQPQSEMITGQTLYLGGI